MLSGEVPFRMNLILGTLAFLFVLGFALFFFWASSGILNASELLFTRNEAPISGEKISPPERLKILTYNMGYASGAANDLRVLPKSETLSNLKAMRTFFEKSQFDFILLQEVDLDAFRSGHLDQSDYLSDHLYSHSAIAVNWDKNYIPYPYGLPHRHFGKILAGQVTLSRYPIQNARRHVLEKPQGNPWVKNMFYLDRLALVTEIPLKNKDRTLVLVNIHLEAFALKTRENQAKDLRSCAPSWKNTRTLP